MKNALKLLTLIVGLIFASGQAKAAVAVSTLAVGTQTITNTYGTNGVVGFPVTVTATGGGGPTAIAITISGLPTNCTFSPASIGLNSGSTNFTLFVTNAATTPASSAVIFSITMGTQTDATNYFTLDKRAITVTAAANTKTYDGTTTAAATPTLTTGTLGTSDTAVYSETYADKNVGTGKTLTPSVTISNVVSGVNASTNYTVSTVTSASGVINSATLTVASGLTAVAKTYDATAAGQINSNAVTFSGVAAGDTGLVLISTNGYTATYNSANAGTRTLTVSNLTLTGSASSNYTLTPPALTASISQRPVVLTATKTYDATTNIDASILTISNNLDGANLTLSGTAYLDSKQVGQRTINVPPTPSRVQTASGNTGSAAATSISATLGASPANGNTLVAVIATRGTSANRVTNITQTGVSWSRAVQAVNTSGVTTEIWYGTNVSSAGTAVTVNLASSLFASAAVAEYDGILTLNPLDATASNTNNGTAVTTGTTANSAQSNEVWVASAGLINSGYNLSSPLNTFSSAANSANGGVPGNGCAVYLLDRIVTSTNTASSGGTLSTSSQWAAAVATFKAELPSGSPLALAGSAATNYTLTGLSGGVQIQAKSLTGTGTLAANNKTYDGTTNATLTGTASLLTAQAAGTGTTNDGKPYTGDTVSITGSPVGSFADPNVGSSKTVNVTGLSLTGANAGNYSLSAITVTANITKATPVASTTFSASAITYGQTLASSTPTGALTNSAGTSVTGTFAFADAAITPNAGTTNVSVIFTPSASTNYNNVTNTVTVTVNKATPTLTAPSATAITYGQTLASSSLSGGAATNANNNASVSGSFAFTTSSIAPNAGSTNVSVTFTPTDTANYNTATTTSSVTVNKAVTSTLVASSANPSPVGSNVAFSVTVSSTTTPVGSVQFKIDGALFGAPVALSGGVASTNTSSLSHGSHTVTAEYASTSNFVGSTNSLSPAQSINSAPVAGNDSVTRNAGATLKVALSLLLTNDTDADADSLVITNIDATTASGKTLALNGANVGLSTLVLIPTNAPEGDTFQYTISDGYGSTAVGTVTIHVNGSVTGQAGALSVSNNLASVRFFGVPGLTYGVQRSTNNFASWQVILTTNTPGNGVISFQDDLSSLVPIPSSAYYRLAVP